MFCTQCGRSNPNEARFCQKCGQPILASRLNTSRAEAVPSFPANAADPASKKPMLLDIHVPTDRCHRCSALNDLECIPFALGKEMGSETNYGEMGGSLAASAVTMALFGVGAVAGPRRKTTYRTIRLETVLCRICRMAYEGLWLDIVAFLLDRVS